MLSAVLRLLVFILPLALDTFAVSAALGVRALSGRERLRVGLVLTGFEAGMPIVGLLSGRLLGGRVGAVADFVAPLLLIGTGAYILLAEDTQRETSQAARIAGATGRLLVVLGLSVSLDEFAIGFSFGLLRVPAVTGVALIGIQAFIIAQIGMHLGRHIGDAARERAEQVAGAALGILGVALLVHSIVHHAG